MEMHQVRYFLAAARTLNFTKAAEESNVTQPSLTRAIQKLEEEFGGLLFRRERSLTHLTELGRQMVPHLERTYEAAQAAKMLAKGIGKAALAPLNFGMAGNMPADLGAALAQVAQGLPGFELSLVHAGTDALIEGMLKGGIDAAIFTKPRDVPDRLDIFELMRREFVLAVPADNALADIQGICLADLAGLQWVEGDADVAAELRERASAAGMDIEFRHSASSNRGATDLVASGLGCALVPRSVQLPPGVHLLPVVDLEISRAMVFATVSGRQRSVATDALIRAVKARNWS
ncbi:LysR family transcriptional regulator [Sphingorhabdus lacus]|uniref:LysR family transcriptional regulator n=1 Tax=Sphingorhabdus lacus TaxID=392610 RepID=UPI0035947F95